VEKLNTVVLIFLRTTFPELIKSTEVAKAKSLPKVIAGMAAATVVEWLKACKFTVDTVASAMFLILCILGVPSSKQNMMVCFSETTYQLMYVLSFFLSFSLLHFDFCFFCFFCRYALLKVQIIELATIEVAGDDLSDPDEEEASPIYLFEVAFVGPDRSAAFATMLADARSTAGELKEGMSSAEMLRITATCKLQSAREPTPSTSPVPDAVAETAAVAGGVAAAAAAAAGGATPT
jgi:hypothetical protein